MRKLLVRSVAILTFTVGLFASFLIFNIAPSPTHKLVATEFLSPARESHPMVDPDSHPQPSNLFMIVQQPASEAIPEPDLIEGNCGTLLVSIDSEGNIALNESERLGTLRDKTELTRRLHFIFEERIKNHAYLEDMGIRTDLPDIERIPRTILIKASHSLKYKDVLEVVETVKGLGANPIGLQVGDLPE